MEQRDVGVPLGAGYGVSHPLHPQLQGVVRELVHGDHWVLQAAQHGAREGEMLIPRKVRNHAGLER